MQTTLALLLAVGHLAAAHESQFSYSPRATTSDDNLATITTLSDGHLPTCFTNHPTHPCPTDGPDAKRDITQELNNVAHNVPLPIDPISMTASQGTIPPMSLPSETPEPVVVKRDAPVEVANGDYIPQPSEWAIPGNFTFTDTISNGTTGTAPSTVSLTISSSEKTTIASATAKHHSDSYINADSNYDASAIIKSATRDAAPQPTVHAAALSSISSQEHSSANASSNAHLSGTIGTLLSQAMFPGKMRAPTTTTSHASAPATTQAPSTEHIEPIPISQRPNTTAPDASLQAFVHTINTKDLAAQQSASSSTALHASASASTVAQKSDRSEEYYKLAASSSKTVQKATAPSFAPYSENAEAKSGNKLHKYLHSSVSQEPSTTASSSSSTVDTTPMGLAPGNDTQAVTRINTHTAVTLIEAQPTAAPQAYEKTHHHHPRARRFIS